YVAEGQMARAEAADGEAHANALQSVQAVSRAFGIVHQRALAEFQLDELRIDGLRLQQVADRVGKARLPELRGRDVDRHARHGHARALPASELSTHLLDHPKTQGD